jgi:predicted secreted protein
MDRPLGFQEVEAPRFLDIRNMKVIRLSALRTDRLYLPGNTPGTNFCWRLSRPQGHSATERIMSMKNSNDTIGNRTLLSHVVW